VWDEATSFAAPISEGYIFSTESGVYIKKDHQESATMILEGRTAHAIANWGDSLLVGCDSGLFEVSRELKASRFGSYRRSVRSLIDYSSYEVYAGTQDGILYLNRLRGSELQTGTNTEVSKLIFAGEALAYLALDGAGVVYGDLPPHHRTIDAPPFEIAFVENSLFLISREGVFLWEVSSETSARSTLRSVFEDTVDMCAIGNGELLIVSKDRLFSATVSGATEVTPDAIRSVCHSGSVTIALGDEALGAVVSGQLLEESYRASNVSRISSVASLENCVLVGTDSGGYRFSQDGTPMGRPLDLGEIRSVASNVASFLVSSEDGLFVVESEVGDTPILLGILLAAAFFSGATGAALAWFGSGVFVAYRRRDALSMVWRLRDLLRLNPSTAPCRIDKINFEGGVDYRKTTRCLIRRTSVVILIIGPQWEQISCQAVRDEKWKDHVEAEIDLSLASRVFVLPVLVDRDDFPTEEYLPGALASISNLHAISLASRQGLYAGLPQLVWRIFLLRIRWIFLGSLTRK